MRRLGLVVQRWPATRFDATEQALALLHRAGFRPDVVIDVGANRGQWTHMARGIFPDATYHLVEPQLGCRPLLSAMADRTPRIHIHPVAVTRPGISSVVMVGGGDDRAGTGNFIPTGRLSQSTVTSQPSASYDSTTLDSLFDTVRGDHLLLKLDVEGHERAVLEGAGRLLARAEVVVTEFWMFRIADEDMPTFSELVAWLERAGLVLYDFGALHGRRSDNRLKSGDAIFVRRDSPLVQNQSWQ